MKRKAQQSKNTYDVKKVEFKIFDKVFAKQRGYCHWPSVIVDFHTIRPRVAKVEFFNWNHQWAWISFDDLLKQESAEKVVEKNIHRAVFAKAFNEMNIWRQTYFNVKSTDRVPKKENIRITKSKSKSISSDINTEQSEISTLFSTALSASNNTSVTQSKILPDIKTGQNENTHVLSNSLNPSNNARFTRSKISSLINTGQNETSQVFSISSVNACLTRSKSMKRKREEKDVQITRVLRSRKINQ